MSHTQTDTGLLVDADWLEQRLDDSAVQVVDVDVSAASYDEGHIPGAVLWNIYADLKDERYLPRTQAGVESLLRGSGIRPATTVVFTGYAPAFGLWLLRHHGHPSVRLLQDTNKSWRDAGRPWTSAPARPPASEYRLPAPSSTVRAGRQDVEDAIHAPAELILDVRTETEFRGERFWPSGGVPDGARAGRIPTARHLPTDALLEADGSLRPVSELNEMIAGAGLRKDQPIITYCTVGARAALMWFVLTQRLGFERVRVYDGSWVEWGWDPAAPIERG